MANTTGFPHILATYGFIPPIARHPPPLQLNDFDLQLHANYKKLPSNTLPLHPHGSQYAIRRLNMWTKAAIFVLTGAITVAHAEPLTLKRCPPTIINNQTKSWTSNDQRALNRAKNGCRLRYADAPCLKRFDKLASLRYNALCGR